MPKNRTFTAFGLALLVPVLAAWAQAPAPAPPPGPAAPGAAGGPAPAKEQPPTEAEQTLDEAIAKLAALPAVEADIAQKVDMLGETFTLKGEYLKATDYRMRLDLTLEGLGDASGTMIQVCDGKTLWDYQKILDAQSYRRLDFGKVLERLSGSEFGEDIRQQVIQGVGFSGPDALLSGLRKAASFHYREEKVLDDRPVWYLVGQWKDFASLTGPGQPPANANAPVPAYVPSLVKLWIGREDGWPYQLELAGNVPLPAMRMNVPGGMQPGGQGDANQVRPSKILLTYSNVQLNPEFSTDRFTLTIPPGVEVADDTEQFLQSLEQAAVAQAEAKRAEVAKGETAIQPIIVPKAAPEAPPALEGSTTPPPASIP